MLNSRKSHFVSALTMVFLFAPFALEVKTFAATQEVLQAQELIVMQNSISETKKEMTAIEMRLSAIEKQPANDAYEEMLIKTNEQLSLWWNPYGIMVAALGVLFAVLAIGVALVLYRQSKDYQGKVENDRKEYKEKLDAFFRIYDKKISIRMQEAEATEKKIDEMLTQYQKKLAASTKENKAEIQKAIDDLQLQKLSITTATVAASGVGAISPITLDSQLSILDTKFHQCTKCGFGFEVNRGGYSVATTTLEQKYLKCPKCGNLDRDWLL